MKHFLASRLAELIVSQGDEKILEVTAARSSSCSAICEVHAFTKTAEPEEVLEFLRQYHGAGPLVSQFEGTLDHFSGDGIVVFFNDPVPCPDPAERAVGGLLADSEAPFPGDRNQDRSDTTNSCGSNKVRAGEKHSARTSR